MNNKKAQGLSTNAIILIVLGVVVLVVLIIGFYAGWEKVAPWIKPENNVDTIVQTCGMACSSNGVYDYCNAEKELFDNKGEIKTTCYVFAGEPTLSSKYGVEKCPSLCSEKACSELMINQKEGDTTLDDGTYNLSSLATEPNCFIN